MEDSTLAVARLDHRQRTRDESLDAVRRLIDQAVHGCGSWVDLQVDPVIPHSKGGPTIEENLQALCRPCNARQRATL